MPLKGQQLIPPEEKLTVTLTLRVTIDEAKQLKAVAKRKKVPISFVVREGIGLVLQQKYKS